MIATVLCGSRNIFTVALDDARIIECRLKGKVFKDDGLYANPLAVGDRVQVECDKSDPDRGLIVGLEARRNMLMRLKQRGQLPQLISCNIDLVLCVTTPEQPPFRPRFLDRALLQADCAGIPAMLVCNKKDLFAEDLCIESRLCDFQRLGYPVFRVCALNGEGMDELRAALSGLCVTMLGQSGVGKSSIIKALSPRAPIRIGALNQKYDRGNHTTVMASVFDIAGTEKHKSTRIIDTPGIRTLLPAGISEENLVYYLREFAPLVGTCQFGLSCSHEHESGCSILDALNEGAIHPDRYESFLRIRDELRFLRAY
ncbi:MAG: ribosome small subunit-dependent GTPase A [Spirochaetaceae bacterium]|jgi:ribosome biogenesis GTPase|nr:ribosome small subunit-dependent GTPase A [Spirochaetaceae bacterium]